MAEALDAADKMQGQANPAPNVEMYLLTDDGLIPNNGSLPLLVYRRVLHLGQGEPETAVDRLFHSHGWGNSWVNGIYPFHHYHSTSHEVLGIARGRAHVQFGGPGGMTTEVGAGDVVVIPAGVGHCRLDASGLSVVGAYPGGRDWDLCRATARDRQTALRNLPNVPLPDTDPVYGANGPLKELWRP